MPALLLIPALDGFQVDGCDPGKRKLRKMKWKPNEILTWSKGYVCVFTDAGSHWVPARCVRPVLGTCLKVKDGWSHNQVPPQALKIHSLHAW